MILTFHGKLHFMETPCQGLCDIDRIQFRVTQKKNKKTESPSTVKFTG